MLLKTSPSQSITTRPEANTGERKSKPRLLNTKRRSKQPILITNDVSQRTIFSWFGLVFLS
jgi:hypothetical protein